MSDTRNRVDNMFRETLSGTKKPQLFSRKETRFIERVREDYLGKTESMMAMCGVFSALDTDSKSCFSDSFLETLDPNFKVDNLRRICQDPDSFEKELPLGSVSLVSEANSRQGQAVALSAKSKSSSSAKSKSSSAKDNDDSDDEWNDSDDEDWNRVKWRKKYLKYKSKYLKLKNK
jgi:hypothetical protein